MKRLLVASLAILLLAAPALAETKIAYVNFQKALVLSKAGKEAKKAINAKVKKYETEVKAKQEKLIALRGELEKQAVLLSDSAKAQKERDYKQQGKELQRFANDIKDELKREDSDYTKRILNEMYQVLQKLGKDGGYTMILEETEGAVIYAAESIDLTDELIKAYDASNQ